MGLTAEAARQNLAATTVLLQEDMGEIEASHANIRRELMLLSTQTNACDFMDLSDRFVLRCCRRQPESYGVRPVKATGMFKAPEEQTVTTEPAAKAQRKQCTGAFRHYLSVAARGSPFGCVDSVWTERYNALTEQQKRRHVKGAQAASEAQRLGGRGYAPTKRMEGRSERQHAVDDLALVMRSGVEVDPTTNSASRSLSALNLDSNVDFDAGIRALRGSLRKAASAERIAESIQSDVLNRHDQSARDDTGCVTGVPHDVAQLLSAAEWRLQPHDVAHQTFKHFRGSFPTAVDTAATLGKCNLKKRPTLCYMRN